MPYFYFDYYAMVKLATLTVMSLSAFFALFYYFKKQFLINFISEILTDLRQFKIKDIFLYLS